MASYIVIDINVLLYDIFRLHRCIHVVKIRTVTDAESGVNVFAPYRPIAFRLVALFVMLLGNFPDLSDPCLCTVIHNNRSLR